MLCKCHPSYILHTEVRIWLYPNFPKDLLFYASWNWSVLYVIPSVVHLYNHSQNTDLIKYFHFSVKISIHLLRVCTHFPDTVWISYFDGAVGFLMCQPIAKISTCIIVQVEVRSKMHTNSVLCYSCAAEG